MEFTSERGRVAKVAEKWSKMSRSKNAKIFFFWISMKDIQDKNIFFLKSKKKSIDLFKTFSKNETVGWFDWADGEPNNQQGEYCLVMREYHDPFFPIFRDYFWNDFECDAAAHYICEKQCV